MFTMHKVVIVHLHSETSNQGQKSLMLELFSEHETFLRPVCLSEEATFHISRKLNKHNESVDQNTHRLKEVKIKCDVVEKVNSKCN